MKPPLTKVAKDHFSVVDLSKELNLIIAKSEKLLFLPDKNQELIDNLLSLDTIQSLFTVKEFPFNELFEAAKLESTYFDNQDVWVLLISRIEILFLKQKSKKGKEEDKEDEEEEEEEVEEEEDDDEGEGKLGKFVTLVSDDFTYIGKIISSSQDFLEYNSVTSKPYQKSVQAKNFSTDTWAALIILVRTISELIGMKGALILLKKYMESDEKIERRLKLIFTVVLFPVWLFVVIGLPTYLLVSNPARILKVLGKALNIDVGDESE